MKRSKKQNVDTHFSIRCMERLGYIPKKEDLVSAIRSGKLEFYRKQPNRVTMWLWTDPVKNIRCILPYDKDRKQIITILFERGRNEAENIKS